MNISGKKSRENFGFRLLSRSLVVESMDNENGLSLMRYFQGDSFQDIDLS